MLWVRTDRRATTHGLKTDFLSSFASAYGLLERVSCLFPDIVLVIVIPLDFQLQFFDFLLLSLSKETTLRGEVGSVRLHVHWRARVMMSAAEGGACIDAPTPHASTAAEVGPLPWVENFRISRRSSCPTLVMFVVSFVLFSVSDTLFFFEEARDSRWMEKDREKERQRERQLQDESLLICIYIFIYTYTCLRLSLCVTEEAFVQPLVHCNLSLRSLSWTSKENSECRFQGDTRLLGHRALAQFLSSFLLLFSSFLYT